jgi:hypothetical protein
MQGRAGQGRFRHRIANEDPSVSDSAHRLRAQVNMSRVAEVRLLEFINRSPRRLVEDLRVKRAAKEKECRALSRLRQSEVVARLAQPGTGRDNRKGERKSQQKKHRRQGRNTSRVIAMTAPERKFRSRFFAHGRSACVGTW